VLECGVTEGRRAFGNVMKFVMMAMSSNFGNMFSMAGATLIHLTPPPNHRMNIPPAEASAEANGSAADQSLPRL
jgi:hypothetical protein